MTMHDLEQLAHINEEIKKDRRRLAQLQAASTSTSSAPTGMPHARSLSDKPAMAAAIADCERTIADSIDARTLEYAKITSFVQNIQDSRLRRIFKLRYLDCCTWWKVAREIGGGNTDSSVRMAVDRYLKNH
ncbi:MAG: hypothetical protein RSF73_03065 [Ruthenibacterium sp.]